MKISELLDDHEIGNSDFQDYFLVTVRAGGTAYGMYKQAVRELYKRIRGLREVVCERQLKLLDLPEITDARSKIKRTLEELRLDESSRVIENIKRELRVFYNLAKNLKGRLGEITEKRRWELEEELWEYRVREMAALDIGSGRSHLAPNTIEHMAALPRPIRERLMKDVKAGLIVSWYHNQAREISLPSYHELEEIPISDKELYLLEGGDVVSLVAVAPAETYKDTT